MCLYIRDYPYSVSPRIQTEYGKIRTRKTPNMDTFYAVSVSIYILMLYIKKLKKYKYSLRNTTRFVSMMEDFK